MDPQTLTLPVALVGAAAGSLGTWVVSRLRDRERDAQETKQALWEKVHHLEMRIVRLETGFGFYANFAAERFEGVADAQQG